MRERKLTIRSDSRARESETIDCVRERDIKSMREIERKSVRANKISVLLHH